MWGQHERQMSVGCRRRSVRRLLSVLVISQKLSKTDPSLLWNIEVGALILLPHSDPSPDVSWGGAATRVVSQLSTAVAIFLFFFTASPAADLYVYLLLLLLLDCSLKVRCWSPEHLSTSTDQMEDVVQAVSAVRRRWPPDQCYLVRQPSLLPRLHLLPRRHAASSWLRPDRRPVPAASRTCRRPSNSTWRCWKLSWDARRRSQPLQHSHRPQQRTTTVTRPAEMTEHDQCELRRRRDQLSASRV